MAQTRRDFLRRGMLFLPAAAIAPQVFVRSLFGGTPGSTKNLILVELFGGNDGLNTFVPWGVHGGTYYSEFRSAIGVPEGTVLKVPGSPVGFHPSLAELKSHFDQGRVAVIQGVSYPTPNFSHEVSQKIWHTGSLTPQLADGWLARYLNAYPAPSFPNTAEVFDRLTGLTSGANSFVPAIESIDDFTFPVDPYHDEDGGNRKSAFAAIADGLAASPGSLGKMAGTAKGLVQLIDTFATIPAFDHVGTYPDDSFSDALKLVVQLLDSGLGMRFFHVGIDGFDTHSQQNDGGYHGELLSTLSKGLDAFHADLVNAGLDSDTLVVVFSEFGRTVYENGSDGTDHGTVNPVIVFGNGVTGGFRNAHPDMDPSNLTDDGELALAEDFRNVFGTVLRKHLGESQMSATSILNGFSPTMLDFLP